LFGGQIRGKGDGFLSPYLSDFDGIEGVMDRRLNEAEISAEAGTTSRSI
jgi:hypothetical protein